MSIKEGRDTTNEQLLELKKNMELLLNDNKELKTKVEESIDAAKFISDKYDDNEVHMKEIKEKLIEITNQNKKLVERNLILEKELKLEKKERVEMEERFFNIITPIEMERRQNNLELHGLPEENGEDCSTVVKSVLSKVTADPVSIAKCFRFGRKENENGKPRRILIQFDKKEQRDKIFKNRANLRKLKDPMYLNENLPTYLSILRGKANSLRKEKNYKYLWMNNGIILLRKNEFSDAIAIKYNSDLTKIV